MDDESPDLVNVNGLQAGDSVLLLPIFSGSELYRDARSKGKARRGLRDKCRKQKACVPLPLVTG